MFRCTILSITDSLFISCNFASFPNQSKYWEAKQRFESTQFANRSGPPKFVATPPTFFSPRARLGNLQMDPKLPRFSWGPKPRKEKVQSAFSPTSASFGPHFPAGQILLSLAKMNLKKQIVASCPSPELENFKRFYFYFAKGEII